MVTLGKSRDFPAFYSPTSGYQVSLAWTTARVNHSLICHVHQSNDVVRAPLDAARLLRAVPLLYIPTCCILTPRPPRPLSTLFAVPIPLAHHAAGAAIQAAVERAVAESVAAGVSARGKEVTPWLLKRVGELTRGRALESSACGRWAREYGHDLTLGATRADIALVENNAVHGAQIAVELTKLQGENRRASSATMVGSA